MYSKETDALRYTERWIGRETGMDREIDRERRKERARENERESNSERKTLTKAQKPFLMAGNPEMCVCTCMCVCVCVCMCLCVCACVSVTHVTTIYSFQHENKPCKQSESFMSQARVSMYN